MAEFLGGYMYASLHPVLPVYKQQQQQGDDQDDADHGHEDVGERKPVKAPLGLRRRRERSTARTQEEDREPEEDAAKTKARHRDRDRSRGKGRERARSKDSRRDNRRDKEKLQKKKKRLEERERKEKREKKKEHRQGGDAEDEEEHGEPKRPPTSPREIVGGRFNPFRHTMAARALAGRSTDTRPAAGEPPYYSDNDGDSGSYYSHRSHRSRRSYHSRSNSSSQYSQYSYSEYHQHNHSGLAGIATHATHAIPAGTHAVHAVQAISTGTPVTESVSSHARSVSVPLPPPARPPQRPLPPLPPSASSTTIRALHGAPLSPTSTSNASSPPSPLTLRPPTRTRATTPASPVTTATPLSFRETGAADTTEISAGLEHRQHQQHRNRQRRHHLSGQDHDDDNEKYHYQSDDTDQEDQDRDQDANATADTDAAGADKIKGIGSRTPRARAHQHHAPSSSPVATSLSNHPFGPGSSPSIGFSPARSQSPPGPPQYLINNNSRATCDNCSPFHSQGRTQGKTRDPPSDRYSPNHPGRSAAVTTTVDDHQDDDDHQGSIDSTVARSPSSPQQVHPHRNPPSSLTSAPAARCACASAPRENTAASSLASPPVSVAAAAATAVASASAATAASSHTPLALGLAPTPAPAQSNSIPKNVTKSANMDYSSSPAAKPSTSTSPVTSSSHATPFSSTKITAATLSIAALTETISSASASLHSASSRAMASSNHTNASNPSLDAASFRGSSSVLSAPLSSPRPFCNRAGRTYLAGSVPSSSHPVTVPYPLPVDLTELHRQSLRTLLLIQIFGAPVCSPVFAQRPPTRVLEVACGTGFWSMMCHRYFASRGHPNVSFTGIDIAPLAPNDSDGGGGGGSSHSGGEGRGGSGAGAGGSGSSSRPDRDMKWRFVRHDLRHMPWPLPDDGFDLIMIKDVSMALPVSLQQSAMDECIRLLRPGGVLEIWDSDHQIRMLRPHAPAAGGGPSRIDEPDDSSASEEDEADAASSLGAYVMTANTPLSAPLNGFLVEYNGWLHRAFNMRDLTPVPCTVVGPMLLQESEELCDVRSRRLAVPLAEVRWEREGVGGVVTKDGKSYVETGRRKDMVGSGTVGLSKTLTAGQAAVRRTAMLTVVQLIQSLEPILRETSGKSQDEWDTWMGKMMNDLMRENGASCGECLEVGAWWARKKGGATRS